MQAESAGSQDQPMLTLVWRERNDQVVLVTEIGALITQYALARRFSNGHPEIVDNSKADGKIILRSDKSGIKYYLNELPEWAHIIDRQLQIKYISPK